jgi:hypothetical protein
MPRNTDHYPIIQVLDIEHEVLEHKPVPMFCKANWSEYRKCLMGKLLQIERQENYETVEDIMHAFQELDDAIRETTQEVVELSKPSMHVKRWYSKQMRELKRESAKLEHIAYKQQHTPDHPIHAQAAEAMARYGAAVDKGKEQHWVEWQEKLMGSQVWDAHKFLSATPTDGGATRIPSLER